MVSLDWLTFLASRWCEMSCPAWWCRPSQCPQLRRALPWWPLSGHWYQHLEDWGQRCRLARHRSPHEISSALTLQASAISFPIQACWIWMGIEVQVQWNTGKMLVILLKTLYWSKRHEEMCREHVKCGIGIWLQSYADLKNRNIRKETLSAPAYHLVRDNTLSQN